jgi:hypothetical protein
VILYFWIVLALYGIAIQGSSLGYARANFKVAAAFTTSTTIMARARLQSNWVRMSIVTLNLAIGLLALVEPPQPHPKLLTLVISLVFVANEVGMCGVATLEVRAHRKLRKH